MSPDELYKLTPQEFGQLCISLLEASGYSHEWKDLEGASHGFDFLVEKGDTKVAVECKHTKQVKHSQLRSFVDRVEASKLPVNTLIFMTSAPLSDHAKKNALEAVHGHHTLEIWSQETILSLVEQNNTVAAAAVAPAKKRDRSERIWITVSVATAILSLASGLASGYRQNFTSTDSLDKRIQNVDSALNGLRDLEKNLAHIKAEMQETAAITQTIEKEYGEALALKELTQQQLGTIREAINKKTWYAIIFEYVMGFLLGVAASIVATVLLDRYRRRKSLDT